MTIEEKYNWSKDYIPYTVEEMRVLSAKHGMDVSIIIGYNYDKNMFSVITVGKNRVYADQAVKLSERLMEIANPNGKEKEFLEDRRSEHTN